MSMATPRYYDDPDFQKWYNFETGQFKEGAPEELIEKVKAEDEERRLAYEQALQDGFIL